MASKSKKNGIDNAFKAGMWYAISSVITKGISFITIPIFTRMMTTGEYGISTTFMSWYTILIVICTANINYSNSRAKIDFPGKFERYIGASYVLVSLITGTMFLLVLLFSTWFEKTMSMPFPLIVILFIYLLTGGKVSIFQSKNRYLYEYKTNVFIALFTAFGTVFCTFLMFAFFHEDRYYAKILGVAIPSAIISLWIMFVEIKKKTPNINLEYWKYGLSISLPLILHTVSLNLLAQSDRIIIKNICGNDDAGLYGLVYQYSALISIIINSIYEGWNPWFHDTYHNKDYDKINNRIVPLNALICFLCIGCISIGPEAILILGGEQYMEGLDCIPPIVLGIFAQFLFGHYIILEIHEKKTKYSSFGTVVAAIINIVLNLIFIPMFGFVCAAYTTLISYILLYLIHVFITKKMLKINLYKDIKLTLWWIFAALYAVACFALYSTIVPRYLLLLCTGIAFAYIFRKDFFGLLKKKRDV